MATNILYSEVARLEGEIADLNQQIVDGMAMADANRVQAEAALAAMTQHKNNWKARALDMEVHKNNWKSKAQAGLAVSGVASATSVPNSGDNVHTHLAHASSPFVAEDWKVLHGEEGYVSFYNSQTWGLSLIHI